MPLQNLSQPPSQTLPDPDWVAGGFGLYVHWPFCAAKCPYCDFNSHVVSDVDHLVWADALVHEVRRVARDTGPRPLTSIYFGGGTPSLMRPETVSRIIDAACAAWRPTEDIEITLEANPTSVEAQKFAGFRAAGVNRVSLGVQALSDSALKDLGRLHSVEQAMDALEIARNNFVRVSFDLIYARQHQTEAEWEAELSRALSMGPDHLSLYQLTIEPGTAFGDRFNRGRLPGLPSDERGAAMYEITQALSAAAGMNAYEVSNYAKPSSESRHNLVYWRYGDYAGIGPGAHGRLTLGDRRLATETALAPAAWLERVQKTGSGEMPRTDLSHTDQAQELMLMGLRLSEGIDLDRYARLSGEPLSENRINGLVDLNLLTREGTRLRATKQGRLLLNSVLAELLAEA